MVEDSTGVWGFGFNDFSVSGWFKAGPNFATGLQVNASPVTSCVTVQVPFDCDTSHLFVSAAGCRTAV